MPDLFATQLEQDEHFMNLALQQAQLAQQANEVPIGAVMVCNNRVEAACHNLTAATKNPLAHAEKLAIEQVLASGKRYLYDYTLYVTLEPCTMCAGVIVLARVGRVVFGAYDTKAGAVGSVYHVLRNRSLNHNPKVTAGVLATQCGYILTNFFASKRG